MGLSLPLEPVLMFSMSTARIIEHFYVPGTVLGALLLLPQFIFTTL